jgi:mRNA interferase MazF
MPRFARGEVVLVRYPFSDLAGAKVRPAAVVNGTHESTDLIVVPLTSRTAHLLSGEFVLADHRAAGLHVPTAVKRGFYTIQERLVINPVGRLTTIDLESLDRALAYWLEMKPGS